MQTLLNGLNRFFMLAPSLLVPWRYWVLSLFVVSTAFMGCDPLHYGYVVGELVCR